MSAVGRLDAQPAASAVLARKYLQPGEAGADDVFRRVARALAAREPAASCEAQEAAFLQAMRAGLLPSGRILSAAGTDSSATLASCFVQPLGDAIFHTEGGHAGIYLALAEATETMRRGGGVGYDFSRIRPRGCRVAGTGGMASGPLSFLQLFEHSAATIQGAGARSGAQMAVLRCDHPDIEAFLVAKAAGGLEHFNLSVGITDAFMRAAVADAPWPLVHRIEPGSGGATRLPDGQWVHAIVPARALLAQLARQACDHGDPGVLFLDAIARDNPLGDRETIAAANPCGEQPLPPYGSCCLASIDLTRLVRRPFEPDAALDAQALAELTRVGVRLLDNVLDLTAFPLPMQREEALATRRIGLGFTGLADALAMLGLRYGDPPACRLAAHVAETMRDAAYAASVDLAAERGAFARFDARRYLGAASFAARLPAGLRERILVHGLRHSHLLAVAPAGSISLALADNVSPGIEPVWAWQVRRRLQALRATAEGASPAVVAEDHAWRCWRARRGAPGPLPPAFVTGQEVTPEAQLALVAAVAPFIDGGIAKTLQLAADTPASQVAELLVQAWHAGLKGVTFFRPNPVTGVVLEPAPAAPEVATGA